MKSAIFSFVFFFVLAAHFGCATKQKSEEVKQETEPTPALKTMVIDDYSFTYLDVGSGEPVVFVHGTIGDYRTWAAQMDAFSSDHRVIALSRRFAYPNDRNYSDSSDFSVAAHAIDLVRFLEKLETGPVHLVGHSYGAFTSLVAAMEQPRLIKSLTLGEPPILSLIGHLPETPALMEEMAVRVFAPAATAFEQDRPEDAVAVFVEGVLSDSLFYDNAPQELRDLMLDNVVELKPIVSGAELYPVLLCEDLQSVELPVLLIKGEHSPSFLRLIIDQLYNCLPDPGNVLVDLPEASHGLEYENPAGFNAAVLDFIDKH